MMNGVNLVFQRIKEIETRFGISGASYTGVKMNSAKANASKFHNEGALKSENDFSDLIRQAAHKYGVDAKLVDAVAKTESNYSPTAVSEVGAVGIMQLMPDTASSLGVNNIYDPKENIEGGVKYIKQLLNTFDGDVKKAVAAYNAGAQAVKNYNGVPPYTETQNYVSKVLDLYR